MPEQDSNNGWNEWGKHVLKELERQSGCDENLRLDVAEFRGEVMREMQGLNAEFSKYREQVSSDIAALKVKAGIWGLVAGAIPGVVGFLIQVFGK